MTVNGRSPVAEVLRIIRERYATDVGLVAIHDSISTAQGQCTAARRDASPGLAGYRKTAAGQDGYYMLDGIDGTHVDGVLRELSALEKVDTPCLLAIMMLQRHGEPIDVRG